MVCSGSLLNLCFARTAKVLDKGTQKRGVVDCASECRPAITHPVTANVPFLATLMTAIKNEQQEMPTAIMSNEEDTLEEGNVGDLAFTASDLAFQGGVEAVKAF